MQSLSNLNIKKKRFSYFGLCPSPLTEHSGNRLAHYCPLSRSESFSAHTSSPVTFKNLEQCPTLRRVGRGGKKGAGGREDAESGRAPKMDTCSRMSPPLSDKTPLRTPRERDLIWQRNPHPDPQARGHTSLTQHGQSLYRKYFTSYSNKPTKLWIKIWGRQKKKKKKGEDVPDTRFFRGSSTRSSSRKPVGWRGIRLEARR